MSSGRKPNHLPVAKGIYVPGATDVMLDYSIDGVFMRIYYPTDAKVDQDNHKKWIPWIPDANYLEGIASVLMLLPVVVKGLIWWSGNIHIPVLFGEKIRKPNGEKMKCIILSHGLGGSRFLYSLICYELASHGFVVFAIEHRDKSAAYTYYYQDEQHAKNDYRSNIRYKRVPLSRGHFEKRNKQVHQRSDECVKVLDFILGVNAGNVPHNVLDDVMCKERECNFKLSDLVGQLDVENIIMMGHSFGGATALLTLSRRKELRYGVLLDPWMFSIKNEKLDQKVDQPLLFVNTQTFHVSSNTEAMSRYMTDPLKREMYTILHTTHENQSDSVLLIGYWLNWFMKKLDPFMALRINNSLILKFLNVHVGYPSDAAQHEDLINEQSKNIDKGLTKPWI
ncbi:platelet-activating factor acetylhydrolase-like [Harmonia axyridis]|uniref:platelet-activating factor acetylhydrolase-like n=1 Tax=Harmonia axyridis TaxID=115357 RepID=UPI001E276A23|nr:platelet-activating factor acetylhydrolase-like [Harmonia axyridis]XP_045476466.1 platelet-activating factor acetylhydrolase-like [Harmonia axyridis]XP_045476467.1 platelet-activating factor acetylhydrolase-like [Harmonia axyridis]XP_045476468.1 platelet-activating factor acetylhydrolase-like [Harmonia axyridis]